MLQQKPNISVRKRCFWIIAGLLVSLVVVISADVMLIMDVVQAPVDEVQSSAIADSQQTDEVKNEDQEISLAIGGDMMFDRAVDYNFRGDKLFEVVENIKDEFKNVDVGLVNLEGPISSTEIPADNTANNMIFNFPSKTTDVLQSIGVKSVSLANNHSFNNGQKGFENTIKVLEERNIKPIGSQSSFGDFSIGQFQKGNAKLSIIAINSLEVDRNISTEIRQQKEQGAFVLIFPHWGIEYQQTHSVSQQKLAEAWIDAGADMVVGGHPHVVQDMAVYKGKPIFYSLGNLLFDQTFSKETQEGLILKGSFSKKGTAVEIWPTVSKKLKPEIASGEDGNAILENLIKDYKDYQLGNYPKNLLYFPNDQN